MIVTSRSDIWCGALSLNFIFIQHPLKIDKDMYCQNVPRKEIGYKKKYIWQFNLVMLLYQYKYAYDHLF